MKKNGKMIFQKWNKMEKWGKLNQKMEKWENENSKNGKWEK